MPKKARRKVLWQLENGGNGMLLANIDKMSVKLEIVFRSIRERFKSVRTDKNIAIFFLFLAKLTDSRQVRICREPVRHSRLQ